MNFIFYGVDFGHKPGEFCKRQTLDYHFISFFKTDFLYEQDGRLYRGNAGDMLILPKGSVVYHGPTPEMKSGFINDWMYIEGDDFFALTEKYSFPIGKPFKVGGRRTLSFCIEKIHEEISFTKVGYAQMCNLYMCECMLELYRAYLKENGINVKDKLDELRGEMARNPKRSWSLSEMAGFVGYSESRFSAIYRSIYSVSPINDLIKMRIEAAKSLLLYSTLQIGEIADAVGFSSVYYFSRHFKKITGISPSKYRSDYC